MKSSVLGIHRAMLDIFRCCKRSPLFDVETLEDWAQGNELCSCYSVHRLVEKASSTVELRTMHVVITDA